MDYYSSLYTSEQEPEVYEHVITIALIPGEKILHMRNITGINAGVGGSPAAIGKLRILCN